MKMMNSKDKTLDMEKLKTTFDYSLNNHKCHRHKNETENEEEYDRWNHIIESLNSNILDAQQKISILKVWDTFKQSNPNERRIILDGILQLSCFSQLSNISTAIESDLKIDFLANLPTEISLKILKYLDSKSLCNAAQVSKTWNRLADDNIVWHNMCEQHIDRKCRTCGWGLPLLIDRVQDQQSNDNTMENQSNSVLNQSQINHRENHENDVDWENSEVRRRQLIQQQQQQQQQQTMIPNNNISLPAGTGYLDRNENINVNNNNNNNDNNNVSNVNNSLSTIPSLEISSNSKKRALVEQSKDPLLPNIESMSKYKSMHRSWKDIFAERHVVERNWRTRNYKTKDLIGHTDSVMCLQYDHAKGLIVSGSYDYTIRVWNSKTGECIKVLKGHTRCVRGIQFDSNKIISASMDRTLRVWNMHTMECIRVLEGHQSGVVCLHFRDKLLASGSVDGSIRIWDLVQGRCFTLEGGTQWINKVQLIDNERLLSCSDDSTIKLWSITRREVLRTFTGHAAQIQTFQVLLTSNSNSNNSNSNTHKKVKHSESNEIHNNSSSSNNHNDNHDHDHHHGISSRQNIDAGHTNNLHAEENNEEQERVDPLGRIQGKLITGSLDNTLKIWDLETGECTKTLFGHLEGVWCISTDSLRIISGSQDHKIHVWDAESGIFMYMLSGHNGAVLCCQLTDTQVVSGGEDGLIRIWDFGVDNDNYLKSKKSNNKIES